MKNLKSSHLILISIILFSSCAIKPNLSPIDIYAVNINKDANVFFEFSANHKKVTVKNKTNFAGIHHDVDENNFLPLPFTEYIKHNIISNLTSALVVVVVVVESVLIKSR